MTTSANSEDGLIEALKEIRQITGTAMDFGDNNDAVQRCYKLSRDAVGAYCMNAIVEETEKLSGYSDTTKPRNEKE